MNTPHCCTHGAKVKIDRAKVLPELRHPSPLGIDRDLIKALLLGIGAVLAAVFSSGCGTPDGSVSSAGSKGWELGSRVGDAPGRFMIYRGTSQDEILYLLGEPTRRKPNTKDPSLEEWVYERHVEFGYSQKGMNVGARRVTSYQRQRYSETARITFKEGRVDDIRVLRSPEDIEGDALRELGM